MGEQPQTPRRMPGGALPPRYARPRSPESNGHAPAPPPPPARRPLTGEAWRRLDAEDEQRIAAERTAFRRVADVLPDNEVRASGRPSPAVLIGTLLVVAVVVLAVVLYRMAPP